MPFVFWYSNEPVDDRLEKIGGCFFKEFGQLIKGEAVCLSADRIGCMGGKFYTGFSAMSERIPTFVSCKEKYKKSPELVLDFVEKAEVPRADMKYLNISPLDKVVSFEYAVGLFFLATPDMLSGLASWTFFDNNSNDAITAKFGSGCSSIFWKPQLKTAKMVSVRFSGFSTLLSALMWMRMC